MEVGVIILRIYTDGSFRSTGKKKTYGSVAYIIDINEFIFMDSGTGGTNKVAELIALKGALDWLYNNRVGRDVCIVTDSMYCVNIFNNYQRVLDKQPHKRISNYKLVVSTLRSKSLAMSICRSIAIKHVKSHGKDNGISLYDYAGNMIADTKARELALLVK